jgi:hypothetical protein
MSAVDRGERVSFMERPLYPRGKLTAVSVGVPEPLWTLWRRNKFLAPAGSQTPVQTVVLPTELSFNLKFDTVI